MRLLAAIHSVKQGAEQLVLGGGHVVAKAAPKRELGKQGSGHFFNPVVGS